jgi:hypothetical protein
VTSPQWHRQLVCIPHEQATMRTNVRSGRRGCPRGQRVGALLSSLLIAGMHTCCAPFAPLAGKSPSRHVTRAPSATDWIAPWMQMCEIAATAPTPLKNRFNFGVSNSGVSAVLFCTWDSPRRLRRRHQHTLSSMSSREPLLTFSSKPQSFHGSLV